MKKLITLFLTFISINSFSQNPLLLKDVTLGNNSGTIQHIVKTTNYTFFNENDGGASTDRSLYRTDGTAAGTIKLNLTYPTYLSTKADKLTALGNKIIFAGDNHAPDYGEIWASDGTQAGTIAIERFQPTIGNRGPVYELAAMNGYVYYGVTANNNKTQIKRTDGTPGGTSVVYEFTSYTTAPEPGLFKVINGILYFNLYDANGTRVDQLWRSDGTTAGTYLLKDFGLDQFAASWYMPAENLFYWMIVKPGTGNVLWKSDGTVAGTVALKTIGTSGNNNYPQNVAIGSTLYFAGRDANGLELWKTDGTNAGTIMVADINPGVANSSPFGFVLLNNYFYFSATNAASGNELWKSDGTAAGTVIVKDIYPGTSGSNPAGIVESNGTIMFRAANDPTGNELWISDGTAANTKLVADINPSGASNPNLLTPGNPVFFAASNGVNGFEVFKYDNSGNITDIHTKIYVNDNSLSNDVFTTAIGNDANAGTKAAPVATINYAASIAEPGDTIYIDAGIIPSK
jgi:ELWxxDGT repeat protein